VMKQVAAAITHREPIRSGMTLRTNDRALRREPSTKGSTATSLDPLSLVKTIDRQAGDMVDSTYAVLQQPTSFKQEQRTDKQEQWINNNYIKAQWKEYGEIELLMRDFSLI